MAGKGVEKFSMDNKCPECGCTHFFDDSNKAEKVCAKCGLVLKESMTLDRASQHMRQKYNVDLPVTTLHDWVVASA